MLSTMKGSLLVPLAITALILVSVLVFFVLAFSSTSRPTGMPENHLWWQLLAVTIWSGVFVSLVFSFWGLATGAWGYLLFAAILSLPLMLSSIFVLTSLVTLLQVAAAVAVRLRASWQVGAGLMFLAVVAWMLLYGRSLLPFWIGAI